MDTFDDALTTAASHVPFSEKDNAWLCMIGFDLGNVAKLISLNVDSFSTGEDDVVDLVEENDLPLFA